MSIEIGELIRVSNIDSEWLKEDLDNLSHSPKKIKNNKPSFMHVQDAIIIPRGEGHVIHVGTKDNAVKNCVFSYNTTFYQKLKFCWGYLLGKYDL